MAPLRHCSWILLLSPISFHRGLTSYLWMTDRILTHILSTNIKLRQNAAGTKSYLCIVFPPSPRFLSPVATRQQYLLLKATNNTIYYVPIWSATVFLSMCVFVRFLYENSNRRWKGKSEESQFLLGSPHQKFFANLDLLCDASFRLPNLHWRILRAPILSLCVPVA